ncbi:NAD(P)-binding protein [Cryphonectria parasitica EP155]|uniref:NAD(P)-binding protein n=1 Tax=Cryphonectria parasitica (strain ATCC 38755 / EP155) TaxID=660469 RepID=A0A9P5CQL1_CRYP1|nr:NAD(P)-binding protein [Cryphonectria parasitica EP155]KAF3767343.1 NAD(P)-binding protein [Cryphonectria parasitica EP155]
MSANTNTNTTLPSTYRALQFHSPSEPATIVTKPTPTLPPPLGTAIIKPLQASVVSYTNEIFQNGNPRGYKYPLPLVPGVSCIGRLVGTPADAPALQPGQLVLVDAVIRARDQEAGGAEFLLGYHGGRGLSYRIMEEAWRDGTWAEVLRVPVENVHVLDEARLLGATRLGYKLEDLGAMASLAVPYGGLATVKLRPGETVIVAPATGGFGGAAVHVALALGARVIAMGRNEAALAGLEALGQGSAAAAGLGSKAVDVFFEISPPRVVDGPNQTVPYLTAAIKSLRKKGRAVFMGGILHDVSLPVWDIAHGLKTLQGWWMYTPTQLEELIHLLESGTLRVGAERGFKCSGVFPLEKWEEAFEVAARESAPGSYTVLAPNRE